MLWFYSFLSLVTEGCWTEPSHPSYLFTHDGKQQRQSTIVKYITVKATDKLGFAKAALSSGTWQNVASGMWSKPRYAYVKFV